MTTFDILRYCLKDFNYVWMATNGSQTKSMLRLHNIIQGCDFESFDKEEYCHCDNPEDECYCEPRGLIDSEDKLTVALSQNCFHSSIDERIVKLWKNNSKYRFNQASHYEIRTVTNSISGIIAQGRAKRTGSGFNTDDCVCSCHLIRPDGQIKMCGCKESPIIGDVWHGINDRWQEILSSEKYQRTNCCKSIKKKWLREAA